jgi:hypothetical protein
MGAIPVLLRCRRLRGSAIMSCMRCLPKGWAGELAVISSLCSRFHPHNGPAAAFLVYLFPSATQPDSFACGLAENIEVRLPLQAASNGKRARPGHSNPKEKDDDSNSSS